MKAFEAEIMDVLEVLASCVESQARIIKELTREDMLPDDAEALRRARDLVSGDFQPETEYSRGYIAGMERAAEIAILWRCKLPSTCCDEASDYVCQCIRNEIHEEIAKEGK